MLDAFLQGPHQAAQQIMLPNAEKTILRNKLRKLFLYAFWSSKISKRGGRNRMDLGKKWSYIFQDSQYPFCKKDPQMHPQQCLCLCCCAPETALCHIYSLSVTVALIPDYCSFHVPVRSVLSSFLIHNIEEATN